MITGIDIFIDMVLTVETPTAEFANASWTFIEAGGYQPRRAM